MSKMRLQDEKSRLLDAVIVLLTPRRADILGLQLSCSAALTAIILDKSYFVKSRPKPCQNIAKVLNLHQLVHN